MILKLSDLQRSLDLSLATTHGPSRIFVIVARYCTTAVWRDDVDRFRSSRLTLSSLSTFVRAFCSYAYWNTALGLAERAMDVRARMIKMKLWLDGLRKGGLSAAANEAAGLQL